MAGSGMRASKWGVFSTGAGQYVTAAVVGGTASELGGGKFANGAVTGAYTMLFNHIPHKRKSFKGNAYYVVEEGGTTHAAVYFPEEDVLYELYNPNSDETFSRVLNGESKEKAWSFAGDPKSNLRAYETADFQTSLEGGRGKLKFIEMSVANKAAAIAYFESFNNTGNFRYNFIANNCKSHVLQGLILGGSTKAAINYISGPVPFFVIGKAEVIYHNK